MARRPGAVCAFNVVSAAPTATPPQLAASPLQMPVTCSSSSSSAGQPHPLRCHCRSCRTSQHRGRYSAPPAYPNKHCIPRHSKPCLDGPWRELYPRTPCLASLSFVSSPVRVRCVCSSFCHSTGPSRLCHPFPSARACARVSLFFVNLSIATTLAFLARQWPRLLHLHSSQRFEYRA